MTLNLVLKKKWFDMISSGDKKEEYRDISKHWISRLCCTSNILDGFKMFDTVKFTHGYATDAPAITLSITDITVGEGKPEWGAEKGKEYFIIKLGDIHQKQEPYTLNITSDHENEKDYGG